MSKHAEDVRREVLQQIHSFAASWQPWDSEAWLRLREEAWTFGQHGVLPALLESAQRASQRALQEGQYSLKSQKEAIDLAELRTSNPSYRWLGSKTRLPAADLSKAGSGAREPAPLSFSMMEEIEVGHQLADAGSSAVVSTEVCAFTEDGRRFDSQQGSRSSEASLLVRTDAEQFLLRAAQGLSLVGQTHELLTALEDPYVLLCRGVVAFRGSSADGFPFLKRPASLNLVLRARPFRRASLVSSKSMELFEDERLYHSLLERLNLVALAALDRAQEDATAGRSEHRVPHVVLGIRPGDYPLNSLALALQEWHKVYAPHFASMVVACGCSGSKDVERMQRLERLTANYWTPSAGLQEAVTSASSKRPDDEEALESASCDLASTIGSEGDATIDKKVFKGLQAAAAAIAEIHKQSDPDYRPRTPKTCTGKKRPSGCLILGEAVLAHQAMKSSPASGADKPSSWFGRASTGSTEASSRNSEVSSRSSRSSSLAVRVQAELAKQQLMLLPEWHHASQQTKVTTVPTPSRAISAAQEQGDLDAVQNEVRCAARAMLRSRRGSQEAAELKSKLEALRHGHYDYASRPGSRRSNSVRGGQRQSEISEPTERQSLRPRRPWALHHVAVEARRPLTSR